MRVSWSALAHSWYPEWQRWGWMPGCRLFRRERSELLSPSQRKLPMIELVDVTQHYGVRPVLKRISLRIERGEIVIIVGPNGMGKTTLLGVMAGVLQPQHGQVTVNGLRRRSSVEDELA